MTYPMPHYPHSIYHQQQISQLYALNPQHPHQQQISNRSSRKKPKFREYISDDTISIHSQRSITTKQHHHKKNKSVKSRWKRNIISEKEKNELKIKDLFTKAINNRLGGVEECFASGMSSDTQDEHGNTILHIAAQNGNKRIIKLALRWRANINLQNNQGQTPLHYLFTYKYENLAAYLISKGNDDSIQNEFGYTCYDGLRPTENQ